MGAVFAIGFLAFFLFIIGELIVGSLLLIAGLRLKRRYKKNAGIENSSRKRRKWPYISLISIGSCILVLPVCVILAILAATLRNSIDQHTKLGVNAINGHYEKAEELLEKGVNPDCTKKSNQQAEDGEFTILAYLVSNGFDTYPSESGGERYPSRNDLPEELLAMERLLLEHGADPNYRVSVDNPNIELPHTAEEAEGSEITSGYHDCGKTPLLLAVKEGDLESVKLLLEYGADIQAADDCGYNAVLVAASTLEDDTGVEMLEYLIEQGCDTEAVNNFGQNAIDVLDYNAEREYALPQDVPQQDEMREILEED